MQYRTDDLRIIGQLYVEAVAKERGADAGELVQSIASCARAVQATQDQSESERLTNALLDALRGRKMRHRDSPEMLVRDLIAFVGVVAPNENIDHFVERARQLGFGG